MIHMSVSEYRQLLKGSGKTIHNLPEEPKPSKHRNIKMYLYEDGFLSQSKEECNHGPIVQRYDSIKECRRHTELQLLQRAGQLFGLECQVPLLIAEAYTDRDGKKHRAIYYKADFVYIKNGITVIEDVKGYDELLQKYRTTEAFDLKWKLLQAKYPDYIFRLY